MHAERILEHYDIRPPRLSDAAALAAAYRHNRDHLAPYEPRRTDIFYTAAGQRESLGISLEAAQHGRAAGWLILAGESVVGRINLNTIVRGAAHSAHVGYWVDREHTGRGLATAAVEYACDAAVDLGLHRIEAGTLTDNLASQAVLRKCGFEQIGHARSYLFIDGAWGDHDIFQRILNDKPPG
ncbi:GNAT family N-acetyltransferase [Solicola gregarius]|uniref:GNAT family N-acetyltransferase n=1 Tax=Solicola gregarius TaxID=2908642 RepID=A0AA46TKD9_9ACTN|nr:GNAT family protein [Solicola gregarius]UYM06514.1 GNAT family N-acetyltransferase [Solicola gregarius]